MTKNHLQHLPPNPEGTNRAARDFFREATTLLWGLPPFDVNLPGMHHLRRRKPFAEATPATPNLLVASTEDTLSGRETGSVRREMGSDPSETRHPTSSDFAGSRHSPKPRFELESLSSPFLMLEHSGYLQKENWLREV